MKYRHTRKLCLRADFTQMKIIMRESLMKYRHTIKLCLRVDHTQMKIIM
jgi:hypothetical protein